MVAFTGFTGTVSSANAGLTLNAGTVQVDSTSGAGAVTFQTNGGTIAVQASAAQTGSLTFTNPTSGGTSATLTLNGGPVQTYATTSTTVPASFTLTSNNNFTLNENGGTFTNSGTVTTSNTDGVITVQSTGALTFAGNGTVSTTGGVGALGGPTITVAAGGANALSFTGSQTFSPTTNGVVIWQAPTSGASISIAASQTETITSGYWLQIAAPTVTLGASSAISASSSVVYVQAGCATCGLTVNVPGASGATTITGTQVVFYPLADGANINFAVSGGGTSTLNINGFLNTSTTNGGAQTFGAGLTVTCNNNIELDVENGGTFNLGGTIKTTMAGGQLWLNGLQQGGAMTINLPSTNNATAVLNAPGSVLIQASSGLSINTTATGVTLSLTGSPSTIQTQGGNMTIGSGITISADHNLNLTMNSNGTFSDSGTITSSGTGGIYITGGGGQGSTGFTLTGTGFGTCNCIPITETGTGTPTIAVLGYVDLSINAPYQFNAGASGTVSLVNGSQTQPLTIGSSSSSITVSVVNGSLSIGTDNLIMTNSPTISVQTTSGTGISFNANVTNQLLTAPGGTTATLATSGSSINISPFEKTRQLTFQQSGGSGTTTFQLNGGPVTVSTNLAQINVNSNVTVKSNNALTLTAIYSGVVNAGTIDGTASSGNSGLIINAPTVTNSGTLQALGGGNLVINGTAGLVLGGGGGLAGAAVTLNANGGTLTASQGSITGTLNASAVSMSITTTLANSLTVGSLTSTFGSIGVFAGTPSATSTVLSVASGAAGAISATGGNITLQNNNTTAGTITVGANSTIQTTTSNSSIGSITFSIGNPGTPVLGSAPQNVSVTQSGGGQVYWGTAGISTSSPTNTLKALGVNIIFNANLMANILLSGGTTIIADPPVGGAAISYSTAAGPALNPPSFSITGANMPVLQTAAGHVFSAFVPVAAPSAVATPSATTGLDSAPVSSPEQTMRQTDSRQEIAPDDSAQGTLEPIAFMSPAASAAAKHLQSVCMGGAEVRQLGQARCFESTDGVLRFSEGEAIVVTSAPTVLKSGTYTVTLKSGTAILVCRVEDVFSIRVLCEASPGSVRLLAGHQSVSVAGGQEVVISANRKALNDAIANDSVARRHSRSLQLPDGTYLMVGEVSLVSLAHSSKALAELMHSSEKGDKALAGKVAKLAASLQLVTAGRGAYSVMAR